MTLVMLKKRIPYEKMTVEFNDRLHRVCEELYAQHKCFWFIQQITLSKSRKWWHVTYRAMDDKHLQPEVKK